MPNNLDGVRLAALRNILTTEETCNILGRSRQQLNNILKMEILAYLSLLPMVICSGDQKYMSYCERSIGSVQGKYIRYMDIQQTSRGRHIKI